MKTIIRMGALLEASRQHKYCSGMEKQTRPAFDLPPSQQIGTNRYATNRPTSGNRLALVDSRIHVSDLALEEFGSSCIRYLVQRKKKSNYLLFLRYFLPSSLYLFIFEAYNFYESEQLYWWE